MNKRILFIALALTLVMATLAGCANTANQSESQSSEPFVDKTILTKLAEANSFDSVCGTYGNISYENKDIFADGTEYTAIRYEDADRLVIDYNSESLLIDENGDIYGWETDDNLSYRFLFVGNSYESFFNTYFFTSCFKYDEAEKVISSETKDGIIYLSTEMSQDDSEFYYTAYGYEKENVDTLLTEYVIDEDTHIIKRVLVYVVYGDEKTLISDAIITLGCETFVVDEALTAAIFGEDSRTLTVITDPGTDKEKTYTQTVTKGSSINVYNGGTFDSTIYSDPECTVAVESIDLYSDSTIYFKSLE